MLDGHLMLASMLATSSAMMPCLVQMRELYQSALLESAQAKSEGLLLLRGKSSTIELRKFVLALAGCCEGEQKGDTGVGNCEAPSKF